MTAIYYADRSRLNRRRKQEVVEAEFSVRPGGIELAERVARPQPEVEPAAAQATAAEQVIANIDLIAVRAGYRAYDLAHLALFTEPLSAGRAAVIFFGTYLLTLYLLIAAHLIFIGPIG